jgi:hypothetical protein
MDVQCFPFLLVKASPGSRAGGKRGKTDSTEKFRKPNEGIEDWVTVAVRAIRV